MARVLAISGLILAIAIIGISASAVPVEEPQNSKVIVLSKEKLEKILLKYPNAVPLARKSVKGDQKAQTTSTRVVYEYTLGFRVLGDEVVAHDIQSHTWIDPRDIRMTLEYPSRPGEGAVVTYVNIRVGQSSTSGRAYAIAGGIGYRFITVVVEAENTYYFDHDAYIFGLK